MTANNQLITIATRHQAHLERLKSHDVKEVEKFIKRMRREIVAELADENITEWTRKRLNRKLAIIRKVMRDGFDTFYETWNTLIVELADYEKDFEIRSLKQVVNVDFTVPSDTQIYSAVFNEPLSVAGPEGGNLLDGYFKDVADTEIRRVSNVVRMGFAQGKTTAQVLKDLGPLGLDITDRNTKSMVRTSLQHASSQSRAKTWERNKRVIKGVEWVSTLDSRTSNVCRSLDGQVYPLDKGPRPPIHINCRSTTTAVLKPGLDELSRGRTRSSRDPDGKVKSVSAETTYYSWLKQQPAAFQDSVIGPTRGKLLRNGGLTSERFSELQLNKNFRPATLDEIRSMEPLAFERANID